MVRPPMVSAGTSRKSVLPSMMAVRLPSLDDPRALRGLYGAGWCIVNNIGFESFKDASQRHQQATADHGRWLVELQVSAVELDRDILRQGRCSSDKE